MNAKYTGTNPGQRDAVWLTFRVLLLVASIRVDGPRCHSCVSGSEQCSCSEEQREFTALGEFGDMRDCHFFEAFSFKQKTEWNTVSDWITLRLKIDYSSCLSSVYFLFPVVLSSCSCYLMRFWHLSSTLAPLCLSHRFKYRILYICMIYISPSFQEGKSS